MKIKIGTILTAFAIVPLSLLAADVTGTWKSEFDSQIGRQEYTFMFKQDGTNLTGKASSVAGERKREADLKEGKVEGDAVSFVEMLQAQDNRNSHHAIPTSSHAGGDSGNSRVPLLISARPILSPSANSPHLRELRRLQKRFR